MASPLPLPGAVRGLLLLAGACTSPAQRPATASDGALHWDEQRDTLALLRHDSEVWRFRHGDDCSKPHFHPLALPAGVLTLDQPADHRWHHGLWFSWKLIDGVNYWENEGQTGRPAGRTTWTVTAREARPDHSARIALAMRYSPGDGAAVLTETRTLEVTAPDAGGAFTIDWSSTFTAAADCVLDRTPLPGEPGGKVFGGYAGLSLRLVDLAERQALTADGPVAWNADDRCRTRATAFEYDGVLAGQPVGVAILDHPDNRNAPSPWYAIRSRAMTFFTPAVLCFGPLRLTKGEAFTLRYRVCVHPDRWDAARLANALRIYVQAASTRKN